MATRTIANGGGNWTANGTWVEGTAPTNADDVVATGTSGNVTINSGAVCRSADFTNYVGTLTHTSGVTIAVGDATAGAGNVALKMVAGMTYTLGSTTTSAWQFQSTSGTQQTITTAGKTMGNIIVIANGGSYLLSDTLTMTAATLALTQGTLNTNGQTINATIVNTSGTATRVLTLGASTINVSSGGTAWGFAAVTGLTFNANTSTINFTGSGPSYQGGGLTYNNVVFNGGGTAVIVGANTYANFTYTGVAASTGIVQFNTSGQTVTGTFTVTGNNDGNNRVLLNSSAQGSSRTITAANVSLTNVDFQDIAGAGAATWTGTSLGNALGNSGVTFTTPKTVYGIAAGSFGNDATWSSSSGGAANTTNPICHDTVILDANSGAGTYTVNMVRPCADLICTGFTGTLTSSGVATFFGDVTLGSGMTYSGTAGWTYQGRDSNHTITTAGITVTNDWEFNSAGGTYTLQDNYTNNRSIANTLFINGSGMVFDANDFNVTLTGAASEVQVSVGELKMGNGTWSLGGTAAANIWTAAAGSTLTAEGSTILIANATANTRAFAGGGKTYNILSYVVAGSTGTLEITGTNTFTTLNFSDVTNARSLLFTASTTNTFTNFNVQGTSGKLMTIGSITAANHNLVKAGGGTISSDYLSISRSQASPATTWYAGANSTDGGNNTGWIFTAPPSVSNGDFFLMF